MLDDMRGELFRELGNWDREKTRQPSWREGVCFERKDDGKPLGREAADAVGRRVSLLLERGEWSRAVVTLQLAYAEHHETQSELGDDSLASLGVDSRAVELLEARGLYSASDLARISDEKLLELPGIGPTTVRRVRAAIAASERNRAARSLDKFRRRPHNEK